MLNGTGSLSLRKQDLTDQKNIATGFTKVQAAHKSPGSESGINLSSLTLPPEMSAQGFSNPSGATLASLNLLQFRRNLKIVSSLRGQLVDFLSYTVASNTQINFLGFTSSAGEIFQITVDYSAVTGIQVVSATGQPATGVLAAGSTTFSIGYALPTNQYSTTQLGGVLVYLDGVLQTRNTGNSSSVLDANYYELDNGSGNFSQIVFNVADPVNARNVLVTPNGLLVNNADGVLSTVVQTQAGQINQMSQYVAALAGQSTSTVLGGAPSYTDLLAFGNLVNRKAFLDVVNTWTSFQNFVGRTDGSTVPTSALGEELKQTRVQSAGLSLSATDTAANVTASSLALTAGVWEISGEVAFDTQATTETVFRAGISNNAGAGSAALSGGDTIGVADASGQKRAQLTVSAVTSSSSITVPILPYRYSVSSSQTMFLVASATFTGTAPKVYGTIRAVRIA